MHVTDRSSYIIDEQFLVSGASFTTIEVRVRQPVLRSNGLHVCPVEIVAGSHADPFELYGAGQLHAILLALRAIADSISDLLDNNGASIDSEIWLQLRKNRTTAEEQAEAEVALTRD